MTEQEAVATIEETLLSDNSILGRLAMKKGIDEQALARLEVAVQTLAPIYQTRKEVPKTVAAAFLDLTPDFERTMALYSPEEQDRIEDLKLHVISLGHDLLDPV